MQIPVVIEPLSEHCYRATDATPLALSAEGATPGQALMHLEKLVHERLMGGTELVTLDVPGEDPWQSLAGIFRDDSSFDEWQEEIRLARERADNDPDVL